MRGKTQLFQGALQIILSNVEPVDPSRIEPEDFLPQSTQNVAKLTARLRELLFSMTNPHLRALAECFLIDEEFVRKFTTAPAGIKNHHAYHAGLLEHVVALLTIADRIADLYPELGTPLAVGKIVGRVVRRFAEGFAVEFTEKMSLTDVERGMALGANAYLAKPFTPDQLRDACAKLMSTPAAARSSDPPLGGP